MGKFLIRIWLFLIPFQLYAAALVVVDPFDYFNISHVISDQVKIRTFSMAGGSKPIENTLWKMVAFKRNPCPNIILGDSRPYLLNTDYIEKISGKPYFNLAIAGGTFNTIVGLFWFANERVELKNVYIGVSFYGYHKNLDRDLLSEPQAILRNPVLYFTRKWVRNTAYDIVKSAWQIPRKATAAVLPGTRKTTKKETWHLSIKRYTSHYEHYVYPDNFHQQLETIAAYCKRHGIRIRFIIFPTHMDLQNRISQCHLERQRNRFKQDIISLGTVYDFNYPNEITTKRKNFIDPFHANAQVMAEIVREVWGHQIKYARVYGNIE